MGQVEWNAFCKGLMPEKGTLPDDIPLTASRAYKNQGWVGMADWLGTGRRPMPKRNYRSFIDARAFVHSLKIKNSAEWSNYVKGGEHQIPKLPDDIPAAPFYAYKESGWNGMSDWLGNGVAPKKRKKA